MIQFQTVKIFHVNKLLKYFKLTNLVILVNTLLQTGLILVQAEIMLFFKLLEYVQLKTEVFRLLLKM